MAPVDATMTERTRAARQTPVSDCAALLPIEPLLISVDGDPLSVVRDAITRPATRVIGIVDADGILVGIVPLLGLIETVVARVSPETLLAGDADLEEAARFGTEIGARRMADIMQPPISIRGDATADEAFRLMHHKRQSGIHVVDERGRPVAYLDLLELGLRYLQAIEPSATPSSH